MGLDIYSGQMTRYYCRNWETIVQQQAKEDGIECELITPTGKIKPVRDQTEINSNREFIGGWMEHIAERLKLPVAPPLWDEYKECGYYTDKPDWEAFGALALVQACLCLDRPCPEFIENGYNAYVDPAVKEAKSRKHLYPYFVMLASGCLFLTILSSTISIQPTNAACFQPFHFSNTNWRS